MAVADGLSGQVDPVITLDGIPFRYFEVPEWVKYGGPARLIIHKQPGGARQIDSMGYDPGPIRFDGIMLSSDGKDRAEALYAKYIAGNKLEFVCGAFAAQVVISDLKINYKSKNYVEYNIELTEVVSASAVTASTRNSGAQINLNNAQGVP
jgi:hypothetical protein